MADRLLAKEALENFAHKRPIYQSARRVSLLGCPVENLTLEETVVEINKIIATRQPHQHCVINAGKVVLMYRDKVLKNIVERCSLVNADGQSVVWALKLLGRKIPSRVTGIDLMERLFAEAHQRHYRVFFLGAHPDTLEKVLAHVKTTFTGLQIAGAHHGYFKTEENDAIVSQIAASKADILFVAMGSPKKEYWITRNLLALNVPFCMGVGGSFDVVAGKAKRAPQWVQRIGMEWFYRFIQEPRRLWRRYVFDNFVFISLILGSLLGFEAHLAQKNQNELKDKEIA